MAGMLSLLAGEGHSRPAIISEFKDHAADGAVVAVQVRQSNPFISGSPGSRSRPLSPSTPPRIGQPPKRFFIAPGDERNRGDDPPNKFFVTPKTPPNYYKASPAFRYGCYDPCRRAGGSPTACERDCMVNRK